MRVAECSATSVRLRTASNANVKPDTSPSAKPRVVSLDHEKSGTSATSPAVASSAVSTSQRFVRGPMSFPSSISTNTGKLA